MEGDQAVVMSALAEFGERLDALEAAMRPVLAAMDEVRSGAGEELPPLMRARVDATLAYALNAIFCMYLRTQGQDPTEHPVREEIARVRAAYIRIHEIDAGQRPRPRKRLHAAVYVAGQELSRVLSDGERALHHAANGKTTPVRDVGMKKVFEDSSDSSSVESGEEKSAKKRKLSKRKRKESVDDPERSDDDSDSGDSSAGAAVLSAKEEKKLRKKEKREKKKSASAKASAKADTEEDQSQAGEDRKVKKKQRREKKEEREKSARKRRRSEGAN